MIGTVIVNATFQVADAVLYVAYLSLLVWAQPPRHRLGSHVSKLSQPRLLGQLVAAYLPGALMFCWFCCSTSLATACLRSSTAQEVRRTMANSPLLDIRDLHTGH